jgi:hypothetical protein
LRHAVDVRGNRIMPVGEQSLGELLGGRRGAVDASVPPVAFVAGWLATGPFGRPRHADGGRGWCRSASALAWSLSILVRWPLLGVVVGLVLGQRAYGRGSWVWVAQYVLRVAVFVPLWLADNIVGLGIARVALSWPLVAACLGVSWWVVRGALPVGHPGCATHRCHNLAASGPSLGISFGSVPKRDPGKQGRHRTG